MTIYQVLIFVMVFMAMLSSYATHRNAQEIHKHVHELACVLKHEPLCQYSEVKP